MRRCAPALNGPPCRCHVDIRLPSTRTRGPPSVVVPPLCLPALALTASDTHGIALYITAHSTTISPTNPHVPTPTTQAAQKACSANAHLQTQLMHLLTINSSSRYFDTAIWSPRPFRRRVFSTRSRASACPDAGSRGRSLMLVSVGSPAEHQAFNNHYPWESGSAAHRVQLTSGRIPVDRTLGLESPSASRSRSRLRR